MKKFPIIFAVFAIFGYSVFAFQQQVIQAAPKDPPEVITLKKWINSFYKNDAKGFWNTASKFDEPQFSSLKDVQAVMDERMGEQQLAVEIDKMPYLGTAKTISQKLDKIDYRIDGMGEDGAMYVFTAWVTRVIDFIYDEGHAQVERKAALKVYVTMRDGRFVKYYSDETQMEKSFMHLNFDELKRQRAKEKAGVVQAAHQH